MPETEIPVTFAVNEYYYLLPGSSIVIDLKSVIRKSFASVSLAVAQSTRGAITQLDPFLLKYTPHADFQQGTDQIVVSVVLEDGSKRKGTIEIIMREHVNDFKCSIYAIEDRIDANSKSTVAIHPLKNDRICGNKGLVNIFIHRGPQFGEAIVAGDSIIFRPGPSFELGDELVYRISSDGVDDLGYGLVSITEASSETIIPSGEFSDMWWGYDYSNNKHQLPGGDKGVMLRGNIHADIGT